jgi:3D (Asp-Asp-Asp) domain-containing protein
MPLLPRGTPGLVVSREFSLGGWGSTDAPEVRLRHKFGTLTTSSDVRKPFFGRFLKKSRSNRTAQSLHLLTSAAVRGGWETLRAPVLVAFACLVLAAAVPGAGGAGAARTQPSLHRQQALLGSRSHAALLSLYALDARLRAARQRAAALEAQLVDVRTQRARAARDRTIARRVWRDSVDALGAHLRAIYEQDQPNAVAILFGATSIDDAMTRLDALERSAQLNRQTVQQTRVAQRTLRELERRLASREAELATLAAQARDTADALAQARAERVAYVASLKRQRALTAQQIAQLDRVAQHSVARSQIAVAAPQQETAAAPIGPPAAAPAPATPGQTLTVTATGYSLSGMTATGLPVGPGIVAVDPSLIPLGTRLTIPGYGEGVAADTGSAVRGATIDLWFGSPAAALAWGRRTVVITLH